MRTSRRIWAAFVFLLGLLWLLGGAIGYLHGEWRMLLLIFCGVVLVRLGGNLWRPPPDKQ